MLDSPSPIFYPFSLRSIGLYVFVRIRMLAVLYWLLCGCCMLLGLIGLAYAWHLCHRSRACTNVPTTIQRLLKPRRPDDCPACCQQDPSPTGATATRPPVTPWCATKSRRGAPKRIATQGFACPTPSCRYYRITDAHVHALVSDGAHGKRERIQRFRYQACKTTFSARRHTPLAPAQNPSAACERSTDGASRGARCRRCGARLRAQ